MARPKKEDVVTTQVENKNSNINLGKINEALSNIKKQIGESSVVKINEIKDYYRIPSRSPTIGYVFGCGGTANPIIIELYGPESAGKTLVAENILADFQRCGHFVAFVDAEYSFNAKYAEIQGLDTSEEKFALVQPDCGEDAFTAIINLAQTGQVRCIAIDSVAALVPQAELNGEMTDQQMGAMARMMGKGLRKAWAIAAKNNCTLIFLNQIRMKIGCIGPDTLLDIE
jgi:recombination protein RecA